MEGVTNSGGSGDHSTGRSALTAVAVGGGLAAMLWMLQRALAAGTEDDRLVSEGR